jgi:hypothetical protein
MDNLIKIKAEMKREVLNYYDEIKSEIDISGQLLLTRLDKSKKTSPINALVDGLVNEETYGIEKADVLVIYDSMIKKVEQVCESNLTELNLYFKNISENNISHLSRIDIKEKFLKYKLIYFKPSELNDESNELDLYDLGLLIYYESSLNDNQLSYIR